MPRAKAIRSGPNAQFISWLEDLRSKEETDSNRYRVYNKAVKSLQAQTKEFASPRDLVEVKFIGPDIIRKLEKRYAEENGGPSFQQVSAAAAPKPRVPLKRSATEVNNLEPAPAAKRRTASAAAVPSHGQASIPNGTFRFWYIDDKGTRVREQVNAHAHGFVVGDGQMLGYRIVYPMTLVGHDYVSKLFAHDVGEEEDVMTAIMGEDVAAEFPVCPGFEVAAPEPVKTKPSLRSLMDDEKRTQKLSKNSIDPSRQLPAYLQTGNNAIASSSKISTPNTSQMRSAAVSRSYSFLSQTSRPSSPPASQLASSPSTSLSSSPSPPRRPPQALARAATNAIASSSFSSASALRRTASVPNPRPSGPRLSHAVPNLPAVEHPSFYAPQTTFPAFDESNVFRAGSYTIYLILDTRERGGKSREGIRDDLRNNGVLVEVRSLELGDVAWIAKDPATGRECVLDVVLERKRLDDLVGSIKNGRFHEQKFRLHQSGISRVMYLVEEYDTHNQKEAFGVQISTALSSTQVVDGFMVKETKNLKDTVNYLTGLTQELIKMHEDKDLYVIPNAAIRRHSYLELQKFLRRTKRDKCYVTSFEDYQTLNSKSGFTTVRDTWARMLLCVKGMSAEKVGAVVESWDTPRALYEAFRAAETEETEARQRQRAEEAELAASSAKGKGKGKKKKNDIREARLMLEGVGGGDSGVRAIGQALSTKIYQLMMSLDYEGEEN